MTVLPHSGSKPQELLYISSEYFELFLKGVPQNNIVESFHLHQDQQGMSLQAFLVVQPHDQPVFVYDPASGGELQPYRGEGVYPCFFEQKNYELVLEKKEGCPDDLSFFHANRKLREAVTPTGRQGRVLSGIINFGDEVGFSRFEVWGGGRCLLAFEVEVFPGKMDYQRDFQRLLADVNEEIYNLAFDFLMKTYQKAALQQGEGDASPAEFYMILQAIYEKLMQALRQVARHPYQKIAPVNRVVRPEKVKKADGKTVKWLSCRPHLLEQGERGISLGQHAYLPRKLLDRKKERNYDTYENRFLKWIVGRVARKLKEFLQRYQACYGDRGSRDPLLLSRVEAMRRSLIHYGAAPFLQEVGTLERVEVSSLVMQLAPGYRDVFKYHLMLLKGLSVQSDLFNISLKNTAELYEYWCFLKLNSLLRKKYELERNDLIALERRGITVQLKQGQESALRYLNRHNGERYSLIYNRMFSRLPTTAQRPDNILILEKKGSKVGYHFVFDAKYRLSVEDEYVRKFRQAGPPEDTINTMHRYRDAILAGEGKEDLYKRNIFGAFVLFPHNDEFTYGGKKGTPPSRFYESIELSGIGALPFLPSQTALVEDFLDDLFRETAETAFERSVIQEGTVEYLSGAVGKQDVLIGPLRQREQLQACLEHNMYYTYLRWVQSFLGELKYVAIYQSKRLFKEAEAQGIFYYGEIQGFSICKRKELREVPLQRERDREELVVRFAVKQWLQRESGITAEGYGPASPQRTSWRLLKEAAIYPELHLDPLEVRLWRELRRIGDCLEVHYPRQEIDPDDRMEHLLFFGLEVRRSGPDSFSVRTNGQVRHYQFSTLQRQPGKTLREILRFWQKEKN